ncbi:Zinc metalloprotease super protein [Pseudomonas syringae pv. atrofaciens]|nr:Zinc metalloprotease super protein [Pseudomonas syringae pv. atrofaciens]
MAIVPGPADRGRGRHGQRIHPFGAGAVLDAGQHARPGQCGEHAVHWLLQRAGRVPRRHQRLAGRRNPCRNSGGCLHAGRGRRLDDGLQIVAPGRPFCRRLAAGRAQRAARETGLTAAGFSKTQPRHSLREPISPVTPLYPRILHTTLAETPDWRIRVSAATLIARKEEGSDMLWKKGRRSDNVVDARDGGSSGGGMRIGGKGLGIGGIVIIVAIGLLTGQDPMQILGQLTGQVTEQSAPPSAQTREAPPANDQQAEFVRSILGDTEDTWRAVFAQNGREYKDPTLVLFSGQVNSACGRATSATGPFYCPADQQVYLDMAFFREMAQRFSAAGDFAQAYVIAHEVGHHVQTLLGISAKVDKARQAGQKMEGANGLLVRQELQADCFAGVWAYNAQNRLNWLEPGDIEEALNAANAIGDDRLQQQSSGRVAPDSFTHGTSAQRVRWFKAGFAQGQINQCDTFAAKSL